MPAGHAFPVEFTLGKCHNLNNQGECRRIRFQLCGGEPMITTDTAYLGLLGNPVSHSHSPLMHNTVFDKLGINALYLPFQVSPGQLREAVMGLKALGFRGVNVTIPFKEAVIPMLDRLSPEAQLYQAVNVIAVEGEQLVGYNTDGPGFIAALEEAGVESWEHCLVLGAGGAARSISLALAQSGARDMVILDTDAARAVSLAEHVTGNTAAVTQGRPASRENWAQAAARADLIVNCTPVGMYPQLDSSPAESMEEVADRAVVCDIVYNPLETKFLAMARQRGLTTVNGLPMFVYQGALTLKILLGIDAPVDFMKEVVRRGLENQGLNPD